MAARKKFQSSDSRIVFSTDQGRTCPGCGAAVDSCRCEDEAPVASGEPIVVRRETKGRKGKGVTVITGLPLNRSDLATLGKELKKRCGTGGTVKDGVIEIQGEHRDVLATELEKRGYRVRKG